MKSLVVFALGTEGDVRPLAVVTKALALLNEFEGVIFFSHSQHQVWLSRLLHGSSCRLAYTPSPPTVPLEERSGDLNQVLRPPDHYRACIDESKDAGLILLNFFALEAWHIAEALNIPSLVLHPYIPPTSTMPSAFKQTFRFTIPELYHALRQSTIKEEGRVAWGDVEGWMWSLFSEQWKELRDILQSSLYPFVSSSEDICYLPPPTPVLYLFSEYVAPRPGFWPAYWETTGYVFDSATATSYLGTVGLDLFLKKVRDLDCCPPIYVTFGSMLKLGLLQLQTSPKAMATVLIGFLQRTGYHAIISLGGNSHELMDACVSVHATLTAGDQEHFFFLEEDVPHDWLLKQCSFIVHHGGSGTVAAALRASCPQIICPIMYDQFFWAERIAWLGLGSEPLKFREVFPPLDSRHQALFEQGIGLLYDAFKTASQPKIRLKCASFGKKIRDEDGVSKAIQAILCYWREPHRHNVCPSPEDKIRYCYTLHNTPVPPLVHSPIGDEGLEVAHTLHSLEEVAFLYEEIFVRKAYLQEEWKNLHEGDVIMDVGANIGLFGIFMDSLMDDPGLIKVLAFEPANETFQALTHNLKKHGVDYTAFNFALGSVAEEHAQLTYYPGMPGNSTFFPSEKERARGSTNPNISDRLYGGQQMVDCRVMRLSDVIRDLGLESIRLLKIDVEGAELNVLRGIEKEHWLMIQGVVAEVHDIGQRRKEVEDLLFACGSFDRVSWVKEDWAAAVELDNIMVYASRTSGRNKCFVNRTNY